jgi:hypothetical protein
MKTFVCLEPAVTDEDICVPGTGSNGIRYVVYLEPAVTVLDVLYTWNWW